MRSICLLLLSAIFLFFLTSCTVCTCKKVPCPGFSDPEFTSWFSYTISQQIIFKSDSLTDTITIASLNKSDSYDAEKGCYNGDNGCTMHYHIYSGETQSDFAPKFSVNFVAQTPFESSVATKQISLRFYNFSFIASGINNQGLLIDPGIYSSQYDASLNIRGNIYNNVQTIMKDTSGSNNKTAGPYKIYLTQNLGMIGYEDYPGLQTWIKQ